MLLNELFDLYPSGKKSDKDILLPDKCAPGYSPQEERKELGRIVPSFPGLNAV
jgi:hypothetical protein